MGNRFNSQSLILVGCTLFVLYLAGIPLLMLLYGSIRSAPIGEPGAHFTIANYVKAYVDKEFYLLLLNSVYYAIGTCTLTFLIGTFLAWVSERTNTPFKKLFMVMSLIPFIIPGILSTISWILLLSPKIGLINIVVKEAFGLEAAPFNVYSMWGMIWAESIHLYPLVFLLMSAAFRNMDTSLEEAALTAGSSTFQTFRTVTLAAHAAGDGQRAADQLHSRHRGLRSAGVDRRAGEDFGFYHQDFSRDPPVSLGLRPGRRLRGDLVGDQHHRGIDLWQDHPQGRALRDGNRQRLPAAGDRSRAIGSGSPSASRFWFSFWR